MRISPIVVAIVAAVAAAAPGAATAQFSATNLVSDDATVHGAQITDPGLVNAWGMSFSPTSPIWVSANGTGVANLYAVNPATQATTKQGLTVSIPGDGSVTGQVFNSNSGAAFGGDLFMFVSEDGTISGWRQSLGTTAETLVPGSAANVYKGAAFGTIGTNSYLYGANFRAGTIDVEKGSAAAPALSGTFADPNLPAGFAPFNIQNLGGTLYVTYAQQDSAKHDEVAGAGLELVDSYDLQGHLIGRVATAGTLNAPWGMAIAPASFGALAGALLVGNFGDGFINAYNPTTHAFLGQVQAAGGGPLDIDGLWAISPGNGGSGGSSSLLYFTAGPDGESHGIFGVLTPTPEPSVTIMLMVGLTGLMLRTRRRAFGAGAAPSPA
jgi:uncharacterized protein (TIGR03118 family)